MTTYFELDKRQLNKLKKDELIEICKTYNLTSYKSKLKSEIIEIIVQYHLQLKKTDNTLKSKKQSIQLDEIYYEDTEDNETKNETKNESKNETKNESKNEKEKDINDIIGHFENFVISENKPINIDRLYQMLHRANMRALNMQFKYRSQYPIARYNNFEELKRRINIYNV
jgi:hypothetical protein